MNLAEEEKGKAPCIQDRLSSAICSYENKTIYIPLLTVFFVTLLFGFHDKFKQHWASFYPALLATGCGILLGFTIENASAIGQRKRDENQKIDRVIDALLLEINTHKELLQQGKSPIRGIGPFMAELPTFSFDGIIASGLYIRLPPELQKIVSNHYQFCNLNNYYVQAGILTGKTDSKLQDIKIYIRKNIDVVLEKLKELRSHA